MFRRSTSSKVPPIYEGPTSPASTPSMNDDRNSTDSGGCDESIATTGSRCSGTARTDGSNPSIASTVPSHHSVKLRHVLPHSVHAVQSASYDNSKVLKANTTTGINKKGNGIYLSYQIAAPLLIVCVLSVSYTVYMQLVNVFPSLSLTHRRHRGNHQLQRAHSTGSASKNIYHLRNTHSQTSPVSALLSSSSSSFTDDREQKFECRWYLAESALPHSGLGIFTGISLHKDDMIGYPDICIFVSDGPSDWTHLRSHSFGRGSFFGQYEGDTNRAACEGLITTVNTVPDDMVNMEMVSPILSTNAGLHRAISPGAGAVTHHYGIHGKALNTITAGSEITINYGDWDFDAEFSGGKNVYEHKPTRYVPWLEQYGWCIDYIYIDISTIPNAGRGAFARTELHMGTVVAPAPLQVFHDREIFKTKYSEQLYVNYCIQPADSKMLLFPYGQGVNLINHSLNQPNVEFQWSTNKMHHNEYLDLSTNEEFWKIVSPGSLILEVVALRDIEPGEELLLNYGSAWDNAWNAHVTNWQPEPSASQYVYPSEMDETLPIRTIREQVDDPYPTNLVTMCLTNDFDREEHNHVEWSEPSDYSWAEGMVLCHVLERTHNSRIGDDLYTVSLVFDSKGKMDITFDSAIPLDDLFIDYHVPRRAVRFIEKPFHDDEHLPNAFRHPIELSFHLAWKLK